MKKRLKTWSLHLVRLAICVVALWIVIRGVTLHDRVYLASDDGKPTYVQGAIVGDMDLATEGGDAPEGPLRIRLAGTDTVREIPLSSIATDEAGQRRVEYGLVSVWRQGEKWYLLLAAMLFLPAPALQGVRFWWILRAQGIAVSAWTCVKITFAGNFLNFAMPVGATAGDFVKAYYIAKHTDKQAAAVTSVFLDRVVGLLGLVSTVALISWLAVSDSALQQFRWYTTGMLAVLVVGGLLYSSETIRRTIVPWSLLHKLPFWDKISLVDQAAVQLGRHKSVVLGTTLMTMLLQGFAGMALFVLGMGLHMDAHAGNVFEYYAYYCTGAVVQALPGPPQGLGTVELLYSYAFREYGSPSQIICLALGIRMVGLLSALPGLPIVLSGSYKPKEAAAAIQQQAEAAESGA